jgi:iron-sulfur cluster insertion protein
MNAVAQALPTEMPAPILFTDSAAAKVADLIAEEGNPDLKLRVFVQGGGCSGFQYAFEIDALTTQEDVLIEEEGAKVLVDKISLDYLKGARLDFVDELIGQSFKIENPNATSSCGCGTSFSL